MKMNNIQINFVSSRKKLFNDAATIQSLTKYLGVTINRKLTLVHFTKLKRK